MKLNRIKRFLLLFILCLVLSGLTAIPVGTELRILLDIFPENILMHQWLNKVADAYSHVQQEHEFLLYGYDWLAFAHLAFAILFIGPLLDPVQNIWVIKFGLITSLLIIPTAFIAGYFRGIPFWWQLIDCSFGVLGFAVLWICYTSLTKYIQTAQHKN
jgi:hypothetical protein